MRQATKEKLVFIIFLLPALVVVSTLAIYPLFINIVWSFTSTPTLAFSSEYTLENYQSMFFGIQGKYFWNALKNSFTWTVMTLVSTLLFGLVGALLLNRSFRGRGITTIILLIPFIIPEWISAMVFRWMYHSEFGIINEMLRSVGILSESGGILWLTNPNISLWAVMISYVWRVGPYMIVILLSGLQLVREELYDAAKIDGASTVRRFVHITIPSIAPTIIVTLTILTIWSFSTFNRIYIMTGGGPAHATEVLSILIYNTGFKYFNFNLGAAQANMLFIIILMFVLVYIKLGVAGRVK